MNIISFKLEKVADPFCMEKISDAVENGLTKFDVDWSCDPNNLSEEFNKQVKNNFIEAMYYAVYKRVDLPLSDVEKQKGLVRFEARRPDYLEVMFRDQDAFLGEHNVDLNVIVLLDNGVYQGHIYCWLSPVMGEYCFTMGVRNRVDSVFIRQKPNISHFLLEGVRNFTITHGAIHMMVIYPRPIMQQLLPKLNFYPDRVIANYIIGKAIHPQEFDMCKNCYRLQNIDNAIIDF